MPWKQSLTLQFPQNFPSVTLIGSTLKISQISLLLFIVNFVFLTEIAINSGLNSRKILLINFNPSTLYTTQSHLYTCVTMTIYYLWLSFLINKMETVMVTHIWSILVTMQDNKSKEIKTYSVLYNDSFLL